MKKAQMHMMETIVVLIVFFMLVAIGILFYGNVVGENIQTELEENQQLEAIEIATRAANLPELSCSEQNIEAAGICIDKYKLIASKMLITPSNNAAESFEIFFYDQLLTSRITIREVYPNQDPPETDPWYDNVPPDLGDSYQLFNNFIPVTIYDPVAQTKAMGVMQVEYVPLE